MTSRGADATEAREAVAAAARALADDAGRLQRPLVVVTGKGGVGKTTVAAAIARAGDPAAVVCGSDETSVAALTETLDVDADDALGEFLARRAGHAAATLLRRSRGFTYFVAAAPGVAELVTIGKVVDLARHRGAVIFDAPATGHAVAMIGAPRTFAGVSPLGPIAREARALEARLEDPSFAAYVGVTAPEELAVAELETLERSLQDVIGRGLDLVVVNQVHPDRLSDAEADRLRALAARGPGRACLEAVLVEHRRARCEAAQVRRARALTGAPVVTVPFLFPRGLTGMRARAPHDGRPQPAVGPLRCE